MEGRPGTVTLVCGHARICADNSELREFLRLRNPKCQHSSTLESFLIKPIQRVLKYPLLLGQLVQLTPHFTDEHRQLQGSNWEIILWNLFYSRCIFGACQK